MHEHNQIRLTRRGKIVVGLLAAVVIGLLLYFFGWVLNELPTSTMRTDPVECVEGTFMSYEGTCEPEKVEL